MSVRSCEYDVIWVLLCWISVGILWFSDGNIVMDDVMERDILATALVLKNDPEMKYLSSHVEKACGAIALGRDPWPFIETVVYGVVFMHPNNFYRGIDDLRMIIGRHDRGEDLKSVIVSRMETSVPGGDFRRILYPDSNECRIIDNGSEGLFADNMVRTIRSLFHIFETEYGLCAKADDYDLLMTKARSVPSISRTLDLIDLIHPAAFNDPMKSISIFPIIMDMMLSLSDHDGNREYIALLFVHLLRVLMRNTSRDMLYSMNQCDPQSYEKISGWIRGMAEIVMSVCHGSAMISGTYEQISRNCEILPSEFVQNILRSVSLAGNTTASTILADIRKSASDTGQMRDFRKVMLAERIRSFMGITYRTVRGV